MVPMAMIWDTPSLAARSRMRGKVGPQPRIVEVSVGIDQWGGTGTWCHGIHVREREAWADWV